VTSSASPASKKYTPKICFRAYLAVLGAVIGVTGVRNEQRVADVQGVHHQNFLGVENNTFRKRTLLYWAPSLALEGSVTSSASPTSKGCTTKRKTTDSKMLRMELPKMKDSPSSTDDTVSHTLLTFTCAGQ